MSIANFWAVVYLLIVAVPAAIWWRPSGGDTLLYDLGRIGSLIGFPMLLLQPVLAARWKWLERQIGLDRIMHWHRLTGLTLTLFLLAHPTFFFIYYAQFSTAVAWQLITPALNWETVGLAALVLLLLTIGLAVMRRSLHVPYHWWKRLHLLGYVIVLLGFLHAWFLGSDVLAQPGLQAYLAILFGLSLYVWIYRYLILPARLRRHPYFIQQVTELVPGVRHITFSGGPSQPWSYAPGQCVFVKFVSEGVTGEWHPFTISSSPTDQALTLSIKASGDWTSTLGQLKIGDRALIDGPYGRFSYVRNDAARGLVYIAGGIGITPLRSMIRHCLAQSPTRPQYLFYANKTERDIAFRAELEAATRRYPHYKMIHVLSQDKNWPGENGYVNAAMIKKYLPEPTNYDYFICGPKPMMAAVKKELQTLGVAPQRLHSEQFALV